MRNFVYHSRLEYEVAQLREQVEEASHGLDGNDVIILLGIAQVVKFLPHLFVSAELLGDAAE